MTQGYPSSRAERRQIGPLYDLECEVIQGLESFAESELLQTFGHAIALQALSHGAIKCRYHGDLRDLLRLRTIVAVYLVKDYQTPRPRGLLGQQHFTALLDQMETVLRLHPAQVFTTFRLSAAGKDSAVLSRLIAAISQRTGLAYEPEAAELLLRLRPTARETWEVLARISPRPLSARPWRVYNFPGALHATIASAMIDLTAPRRTDRFLNLLCGSGTLLIERLQCGPVHSAVGCDSNAEALEGAGHNLQAAGRSREATLLLMDATDLALPSESVDVICADLPWGQLVGSHRANSMLYPQLLAEAARVAAPVARMVLITQDVRLLERLVTSPGGPWELQETVRLAHTGTYPRIFLLRRQPNAAV